jgi:hypothetical protein
LRGTFPTSHASIHVTGLTTPVLSQKLVVGHLAEEEGGTGDGAKGGSQGGGGKGALPMEAPPPKVVKLSLSDVGAVFGSGPDGEEDGKRHSDIENDSDEKPAGRKEMV